MGKLRAVDCKNLLTKDKVIKPHQEGLSLAWSYMPHSFGIRCGKMKTLWRYLRVKNILRKVSENY